MNVFVKRPNASEGERVEAQEGSRWRTDGPAAKRQKGVN